MFVALAAALLTGLQLASGQNPDDTPDASPKLTTYKCTKAGGCASQDTSIVLEWDYHWLHSGDTTSCTTSSGIDPELCPDQVTCAKNCKVQGIANYTAHGVATSGNSMTLHQYTMGANGLQKSSPRVYLLGPDGNYVRLELLGQELTVEVDLSTLPCGQNGALYLGEMDMTGGRNPYNTGGAKYGSGYCDAQCPVGTWINGTLNTSKKGGCCPEMDILEANSRATAFTPHPCLGDSCDKAGCGFNPYAQGHHDYYGPGKTVDTNKPFTMTTAFVTTDGTTTGALSRITRTYRQGGRAVASAATGGDAIVAGNCTSGAAYGGLSEMGRALGRGMVLTFSIWNDAGSFMHWLDSGDAGPCSAAEGDPALIMKNHPDTHVVFSNIRWGDIGSTLTTSPGPSRAQPVSPSAASP